MYSIIPKDLRPAFPAPVPPAAIRAKLQELLGIEDIPQEVDFALGATTEAEGIGTTTLSIENSLGETVPGLLLQPLYGPPGPGLVCIPGTSGTAERFAHPRFYRQRTGPLYGWGRELARRRFTVLAISPKGCEARRQSPEHWATENKLLAPYGRTQMGVLAEEALRAARVPAAITDDRRVGLAGMSLGGNATWYAMAYAPWIAAGAPVCAGVGSMARVIHQADVERHSAYYFVPGLLRHFDHAEYHGHRWQHRTQYSRCNSSSIIHPTCRPHRLANLSSSATLSQPELSPASRRQSSMPVYRSRNITNRGSSSDGLDLWLLIRDRPGLLHRRICDDRRSTPFSRNKRKMRI